MKHNIVTSICVDKDSAASSVIYPMLGRQNASRREIYWLCVYVFCWVSIRVNPNQPHLVYTNDNVPAVVDGVNIQVALEELGVTLIDLPFTEFDPGARSSRFRNAFYKLDVVKALGALELPSILLDSDCLWHRPADGLAEIVCGGQQLLVQDTYQRSDRPRLQDPHDLSMVDFGDTYRQIDADYACAQPVWYGGELVGGTPALLRELSAVEKTIFDRVLAMDDPPAFHNGKSLFDNDEYISTYAYNCGKFSLADAYGRFSRRIDTIAGGGRLSEAVVAPPIWHLPAEKIRGFVFLFSAIAARQLDNVPATHMTAVLGGYVGVPRRKIKAHLDWLARSKAMLRRVAGLRFGGVQS